MKQILIGVVALLIVAGASAQELVTLTVPISKPTQVAWQLDRITLDVSALTVTVQLLGTNRETISKTYDGTTTPTGATLLHNLNTGNFSVNSLVKQVYQRLATDGVITPGTISGTAQD